MGCTLLELEYTLWVAPSYCCVGTNIYNVKPKQYWMHYANLSILYCTLCEKLTACDYYTTRKAFDNDRGDTMFGWCKL